MNPGGSVSVGAYMPQTPSSAGPYDRTYHAREVLDGVEQANTPVLKVRKGGYVKSADGIAKKGKTRGKYL